MQVVSPERILWSGEADMVITRTLGGGEIAFLTGHAPFVGALGIGVTASGPRRRGHRGRCARRLRRGVRQPGVDPVRRGRAAR
ncbi:MAG: hypothetical protein WKF43_10785 [Acidimicrobiales bacterium]